ncbi:MalY/PatB family protein [uncultured Bifidobacterium sp.]|uniref:MalY/PatB family protein n=1 Tax=uncultured Bifidobacterium sp. TaxID=165187 RepID=UPI0028DCF762|nr:MalY/PatB family protein [uncultured Bifidobacterium sp.]
MTYDFTTIPDRRGTGSEKWHLIERDMGQGNEDVIALSVADMEFLPAPEIVEAMRAAAAHDVFGYDYVRPGYFEAVHDWMLSRHGLDADLSWMRVSDGVMPAVNAALRAVTHTGDQVIILRPSYPPFPATTSRVGLTIVDSELVEGPGGRYVMDLDDIARKAADPRCTAIILCNPHNPVGRVWTADELRAVGDIALDDGLTILCDEIHADFAHPGHTVTMFSTLGERYARHCIEFTAPTKTFNLAGLACSTVIIPDKGLRRAYDVAAESIGGLMPSHVGLVAAEAAYRHADAWLDELLGVLEGNLRMLRDMVSSCPGLRLVEPEGTYLAWLDCRGLGLGADALRDLMRTKARVYLDDGIDFGRSGAGFERVNLACPPSLLRRALDGIAGAVGSL